MNPTNTFTLSFPQYRARLSEWLESGQVHTYMAEVLSCYLYQIPVEWCAQMVEQKIDNQT